MRIRNALTALAVFSLLMPVAYAQQTPDYDAAARHLDRARDAYRERQERKQAELAQQTMAEVAVQNHICKPMHEQNTLSRRQYIESVVRGRGRRNAVVELCINIEIYYSDLCKPREFARLDGTHFFGSEEYCPKNWNTFPEAPMYAEQEARLAEIRRLYK